MTRIFYIFMMSIVVMQAADDRVKLDASILASIPERRHAALLQYAIVIDDDHVDGSLEISEKTAQYIDTLKGFSQELMAAYYWHSDIPKDIDATIQERAIYLAGLSYPGSKTTGCSYYGGLIQKYEVEMYEDQIIKIAEAVCSRFMAKDVVVIRGKVTSFKNWKKAWEKAGKVKNGPNQALLPTSMSVTDRACARSAPDTLAADL